jgi:peptidoglycan/LPS O-acetylase OafA/YrhL
MSGAHRGAGQGRLVSARKSAVWLLTGAALVIGILALLGLLGLLCFAVYRAITHPADLPFIAIAVQGACWVTIAGSLAWLLIRKEPRSPARLVRMVREACLLLCFTFGLLADAGSQLGWTRGTRGHAMAWAGGVLLVAVAAYWVIGERRLRAALESRAADKPARS